jgi:hypothetical protein
MFGGKAPLHVAAQKIDLEPGVIGAVRASPLGEFSRQENLVNERGR